MTIRKYKGFEIRKHRRSYRIYLNDEYKQTSTLLKYAKQTIDFCLERGVWNV